MATLEGTLRKIINQHPQAPEATLLQLTLSDYNRHLGRPSYSLHSSDARELRRLLQMYTPNRTDGTGDLSASEQTSPQDAH